MTQIDFLIVLYVIVLMALAGPLLRVSKSQNQGVISAAFLPGGSRGESINVVGQMQFLAIVGVRSSFPWWLSTEGLYLLLEVAHIPSHAFHVLPSTTKADGIFLMLHYAQAGGDKFDFFFCHISLTLARESSLLLICHIIRLYLPSE